MECTKESEQIYRASLMDRIAYRYCILTPFTSEVSEARMVKSAPMECDF